MWVLGDIGAFIKKWRPEEIIKPKCFFFFSQSYYGYITYNVRVSKKHDEAYKETVKCDPYSERKAVDGNSLSVSS